MTTDAQLQFMQWARSGDEHWPMIKEGKYNIALLDKAIQEGLRRYLESKDVTPLCQFLESAAKSLSPNPGETILPPSLAIKGLAPNQSNRAKVIIELCEVYGFAGDFNSGWRTCVESGFDCDKTYYLVFGTRSRQRNFNARQAYFFESLRPPLTTAGMQHKAEIFPLVEEELQQLTEKEGRNLFDFYLDIAHAILGHLDPREIESLLNPQGNDLFARGQFHDKILANCRQRFTAGLKPFENRLRALFDNPMEYSKAMDRALKRLQDDLLHPFNQKRKFLHRHFYDVCTPTTEKNNLRMPINTLEKVYRNAAHQVTLPFFPTLIRACMSRHIAKIFRGCEDRFRPSLGLEGVGQGWVSEAALFAKFQKTFPHEIVLHHAKPEWIGRQHLDIYFPRLNVAVEYQGAQHERALAIFWGEAGLRVRQQLDKKKKMLCEENGCLLIEVFPSDAIEPVLEKIKTRVKHKKRTLAPPPPESVSHVVASVPCHAAKSLTPPPRERVIQKRSTSACWKKHLSKDELPACARHGDRELILRLAGERAALKSFRNQEKETLLFIACKEGNVETAVALLDVGLDPNARDFRKASILSKICNRWGVRPKPEIVRLLLERGADPTLYGTLTPAIFDRCGYALPMNGCAIDCFLNCAQVLFEWIKGVNQQQPNSLLTPIMCACHHLDRHQHEHRSLAAIRWLVEMGADLTMRSKIGCTPMDFALGASWYNSVEPSNVRADHVSSTEVLRFLYEAGARPSDLFKPILELAFSRP